MSLNTRQQHGCRSQTYLCNIGTLYDTRKQTRPQKYLLHSVKHSHGANACMYLNATVMKLELWLQETSAQRGRRHIMHCHAFELNNITKYMPNNLLCRSFTELV